MAHHVEDTQELSHEQNTTMLNRLYLSFFLLATGYGQASGQGTKVHGFPMVSGTVWQTCSDWNDYDSNFKIAYLKGHEEATLQITQALSIMTFISA